MWEDIDFGKEVITVRNRGSFNTKNYQDRVIPIHPDLTEILRKQVRHIFSPYVFFNREGNQRRSVRKSFDSALRAAGVQNFTFHGLRHTFASYLVMSGVDLVTVQKIMGHKTIEMTLHYAHLAPDHLRVSVERLSFQKDIQKAQSDSK